MNKPAELLPRPVFDNTYENAFVYVNRPWCLNETHDFCPLVISIMAVIILICVCIIVLLCLLNKKTKFMKKWFPKRQQFSNPIKRMPLIPIPNRSIVCPRPIINNGFQIEEFDTYQRFNRHDINQLSFISTDSFRYSSSDGASLNSTRPDRLKPIYKTAYQNMLNNRNMKPSSIDELPPDYNTVINKLYCNGNIASTSSSPVISDTVYIV
jgi:hypothetical protein